MLKLTKRPYGRTYVIIEKLRSTLVGREGGDLSCLLHWSPNFCNKVFLFFDLITFATMEFDWLFL